MKKSILNIGKALNKVEQKQINGGNPGDPPIFGDECSTHAACDPLYPNSCGPAETCVSSCFSPTGGVCLCYT